MELQQYRIMSSRETQGAEHGLKLRNTILSNRFRTLDLSPVKYVARVHKAPVQALQIETVESRYLLAAGANSNINIFDLDVRPDAKKNDKAVVPSISKIAGTHKFQVSGVNWLPGDTGLFTTGSMDTTVKVWDTNTSECVCTFSLQSKVYSHALSPVAASHTLIGCGLAEPRVRLCDLRTGGAVHSLTGHQAAVLSAKWSPMNEFILATGSVDKSIRFWDIRKARACVFALDSNNSDRTRPNYMGGVDVTAHDGIVNGLCFTSDGMYLVSTGHDERVRLWDMTSGRNTLTNYGSHLINRVGQEVCPVVTPVNMCHPPLLYHPSDNRQILVFDMLTGELVKRLRGHFARVGCVALRSHHQELYSGGNDHEILVWTPMKDELPDDFQTTSTRSIQITTKAWSDDD
ncbi:hypothetical protein SeLEV6574_g04979 [Synchytrium endobioticum]|uniref:Uncharacterized protein n=1 Tax=Synchytrium endobioticum TaxID=286115 RepID=A0A507CWR0_9FUNG|nr:hypothetical protein SeLEV6574_g04979 [Synchytrium endobioticum]